MIKKSRIWILCYGFILRKVFLGFPSFSAWTFSPSIWFFSSLASHLISLQIWSDWNALKPASGKIWHHLQIMLNRKIAILCLSVSLSVKINLNENHLLSEIAPALSKFKNLGLKSEYFMLVIKFTNLIRLF